MTSCSSAASSTERVHRARLVETRGERDEAVARDSAVRRLDADRAGDRSRLADRAAGVGADRERRLVRADRRGGAAARSAGDPLEVPGVVGRAVGRVLGRAAHRELVHVGLAEDGHAGLAKPRDDAWRRTAGPSPRESATRHVVGSPLVVAMSLTAIGTPSRAGTSSPAERRSSAALACASAPSVSTWRNAWTAPSTSPIRSRCACVTSTDVVSPLRSASAISAAVSRVSVAHASSPRIRGTLNRCCSTAGAPPSASSGDRHGAFSSGAVDVLQRERVGRRRDVVGGDLADLGDRLEDHRELRGEVVELGVGQVDPGQMGQVGDLVTAQRGGFGHAGNPMARRPPTSPGRTTSATRGPA